MSDKFCKVYETKERGQILVKIEANDEGIPEIRFYAQPPDLGVCSVAVTFSDDDEGWDLVERAFAKADEEFCIKQVKPLFMFAEKGESTR